MISRTIRLCLVAFACAYGVAATGVAVAQTKPATSADALKPLQALVGDWVSEAKATDGTPILRTISYKWVATQNYLRGESERLMGKTSLKMTIIYIFDPKAAKVHTWVFGSDGSWNAADVDVFANKIQLNTSGVNESGIPVQLVSTLSLPSAGQDSRTEQWTGITVGGQPQPNGPEILWRRKLSPTASSPPPLPDEAWPVIRASREAEIKRYLETASGGFSWFAHAMHGEPAGTPFLLMRSLPELAPDLWGPPEERLARFGFIDDPKDPDRPFPLGLGWVLDPVGGDKTAREYHSVTLTCAACHVGEVKVGARQYQLLVGAPNTRIDVRKFRRAIELSTDRLLSSEPAVKRTTAALITLIKSKPAGFYFGGRYGIDSQAEATERQRFEVPAYLAAELVKFARRVAGGRATVEKERLTNYSRANAPPLDGGSPGQSDGSGDLIPKFVLARELASTRCDARVAIPRFMSEYYLEIPFRNATVTDNLSVWRQVDRPFGQLDGSIRAPIIRNIAAQTAVVGSAVGINIRNADIAARFTGRLPAPPYPFDVDMVRARRGEVLFRQNCATCHRSGNGTVYGSDLIDTDMNRARVLSTQGKAILLENFKAAFAGNEDYVATNSDGDTYKPAQLKDDEIINDRTRPDHQGYVAGPLDGIWARAPYLHNGSVPTLRHLLAPGNPESKRPKVFVRGSVAYDTLNVGFVWNSSESASILAEAPTGILFDTGWDGCSNVGHDRDVVVDGRRQELDWSGPENRSNLEDLLMYLKTL
jgi:mono/diheme cytochrome c family protein